MLANGRPDPWGVERFVRRVRYVDRLVSMVEQRAREFDAATLPLSEPVREFLASGLGWVLSFTEAEGALVEFVDYYVAHGGDVSGAFPSFPG